MDEWDEHLWGRTTRDRPRRGGCLVATTIAVVAPVAIIVGLVSGFALVMRSVDPPRPGTVEECVHDGPLAAAASAGDLPSVELQLAAGADPDEPAGGGPTPFACAMDGRHWAVARTLARGGADPGSDRDVRTAVEAAQVDLVAAMLDAGAPATAAALYVAIGSPTDVCETGPRPEGADADQRLRLVQLLLAHGADARGDGAGTTPLLNAAFHGDAPIVAALLDAGAEVDVGGAVDGLSLLAASSLATGEPCLSAATSTGTGIDRSTGPRAAVLFPLGDVVGTGVPNVPPVFAAAVIGDGDVVSLLLERGADPNLLVAGLVSPLYAGAVRGNLVTVQALLAHGAAPVPVTAKPMRTPAQAAAMAGHPDVEAAIVAAGG